MSFPPGTEMFQFPGFASYAYVFSARYPIGVGCPIRTLRDQSLLAAPPEFSQRATSFIASWCQGIHRMPFSCSNNPSCTGTTNTERLAAPIQSSQLQDLSLLSIHLSTPLNPATTPCSDNQPQNTRPAEPGQTPTRQHHGHPNHPQQPHSAAVEDTRVVLRAQERTRT